MKIFDPNKIAAHQWDNLKAALGFKGTGEQFLQGLREIAKKNKRAKKRNRNKRGSPG